MLAGRAVARQASAGGMRRAVQKVPLRPSGARHAGSHHPLWQKPDHNISERYLQPITHLWKPWWNRAKDRDPQPTALRRAKASYAYDMEYNFPDYEVVLEVQSVLHSTTLAVFRCSPKLNELELKNYLESVYQINTIQEINMQYRRGERWVDGFGRRWKHPDYMRAYVYLKSPVEIVVRPGAPS
eukprot:TRINITY_DN25995_c0_g1_i1.p1 TRINITY_DN25995_c0_g1~~TRINITY_DN25995_c0_g1_i1.p1  ORF type:complete len:202 (+),score=49.84 TRINITY_DN25995_c0_g1_i1:55-606(+)